MIKNAVGEDKFDELQEPPILEADKTHPLFVPARNALCAVYDPEIPTSIYELGLILKMVFKDDKDAGVTDIHVDMTLTSPGCPVAQEMPGMVQNAIFPIEGVGEVTVDIIWEPTWSPSMMAETAKMELNMF
ncbi:MAG: PaaD protein [Alphaproteobacteria bacterium]|nr:MAG: PaaD protein [Alphaproteobacteria bacterium]